MTNKRIESNSSNHVLVTIGLTCFNAEKTIERAINSALSQGWPKIEIIIVDDCSVDGSCQIIKKVISQDPRARLIIHDSNKGPGAVRSRILSEAQGEYIVFFDDDDESFSQRITTQLNRLKEYERTTGVGLLACYISGVRVYSNGYTKPLNAVGSQPNIPKGNIMADYLLYYGRISGIYYGSGTPACALMAHKNTFDAVAGFDPSLRRLEDVDFAIKLAFAEGHFIGCPEQLLVQHATDAPDKSPEKNLQAEQAIAIKYREYLQTKGCHDYAYKWPLLRYYHFKNQYGSLLYELICLFIQHPVKVLAHVAQTWPRRFMHERKMKK